MNNEPKPNTPKYYRLLEKGEIKEKGDMNYSLDGTLIPCAAIGREVYCDNMIIRPVQVDEWIEYAKQKPTKEDFEPTGTMECMHDGKPYLSSSTNCEFHDEGYWRRITPPPAKPKSKTVPLINSLDGRELRRLSVNSDGTVSLACGEIVSAESIDAFIKARLEVTKQ